MRASCTSRKWKIDPISQSVSACLVVAILQHPGPEGQHAEHNKSPVAGGGIYHIANRKVHSKKLAGHGNKWPMLSRFCVEEEGKVKYFNPIPSDYYVEYAHLPSNHNLMFIRPCQEEHRPVILIFRCALGEGRPESMYLPAGGLLFTILTNRGWIIADDAIRGYIANHILWQMSAPPLCVLFFFG